jgi:hypothetical protein
MHDAQTRPARHLIGSYTEGFVSRIGRILGEDGDCFRFRRFRMMRDE